jgi:hypothetical protein
VRRRRHRDAPALAHNPFTRQQRAEQFELVVGKPSAAADIQTEVLELLGPITDSEHHRHPTGADDVEDREILSEAYRVVERQDHHEAEKQTLGAGRNCGRENDRRRQVTIFGTMVLTQHRGDAASGLRPCAHVAGRPVQLGGRRSKGRRAHVEPQGEHLGLAQSKTCRGRVVGISRELSNPGGASTTNGTALTTRIAVAAMAACPAPWPSASPRVMAQ